MIDLLQRSTKRILPLLAIVFFLLWVLVSLWMFGQGEIQTADDVLNLLFSNTLLFALLIFLAAILLLQIAWLLAKSRSMRGKKAGSSRFTVHQKQKIAQKIEQAKELMQSGGPSSYRSAIIMLDNLLDFSLGCLNYSGSLGEKLQKANDLFDDIDGVWKAHKYRNKLVHDIEYEVFQTEAYENMDLFIAGLRDLGAI